MSRLDPATNTPAALAALRAVLVAAQSAPQDDPAQALEEQEQSDISTPRARAAAALEAALQARRDWHRERGERAGAELCKTLMEMCAWHEHPQLRERILALQSHGLALLEASPATQPSMGAVGDLQDEYMLIKPREDDAAAIAAALGLTPDEARAYGLVGTIAPLGVDEPPTAEQGAAVTEPGPEETLEEIFRREARLMVTRTLPHALQQFWRNQQSLDALLTVRRAFHTLKGDARVTAQTLQPAEATELTGLAVLSEAAEDVIDMLLGDDYDASQPAPALPAGAFSLLQEAADRLVQRLDARAPLPDEAPLLQRLYAMHRKAAALSGRAVPESPAPAPPPPPTVKLSLKPSSYPLLPTFLEESERLMADLHRSLAALSENPSDENALVRARAKLHTLKGGAALVGDEAEGIQLIAHSAEDLFELIEDYQLRGEMTSVPKAVLEGVLDAEEALQTLFDILKMQSRSGRLSSIHALSASPKALSASLNDIAERVRGGTLDVPPGNDAAAAPRPRAAATAAQIASLMRRAAIASVGPLPDIRRGAGALDPAQVAAGLSARGTAPLDPSHLSAARGSDPLAPAAPDLQTIHFADLLERSGHTEQLAASTVTARARAAEDQGLVNTIPFRLYSGVQYLSSYVQEIDRYRALVRANGHIYIFGKPDVEPPLVEGVTIVPLAATDVLSTERIVLLDSERTPCAFIAHPAAGTLLTLEQQYACLTVEDPALVREAVRRLRLALQRDAALIEARRAELPSAPRHAAPPRPSPPLPTRTPPLPEPDPKTGVRMALELLGDLSVKRDALMDLLSRMARQSGESRRSTRRLRTLVERVGSELADLRSELARTSGRHGDWDLLEKEEYTAVDVLLMQLDEALADLEQSDNTSRRDLGEAQALMESQASGQLRAQRALLNISMVPLSQIDDRLAYAVRSQSRRLNKHVEFALEGGDLLLDGRIADALFDPLMHLINNAIDHGIEAPAERVAAGKAAEGHLTVRGHAAGDSVIVEVIDDGQGIDPAHLATVAVERKLISAVDAAALSDAERLALIWRPGFSTSRTVSTVSGRGIGMQSVRDDIVGLQGQITVRSAVGRGTTFMLQLPRSLAMLRVLVVREGNDLVAMPITQLAGTFPVPYRLLEPMLPDGSVRIHDGERQVHIYPVHLAAGIAGDGEAGYGTLLEMAGRAGGLLVDEVLGSQYLPVRPAPAYLRQSCALIGHALGSGGRILPILDVPTLLDRALRGLPQQEPRFDVQPVPTVLVVDDSPTMRRALSDTLTRAGFEVRTATDGRDALHACTRSMPALITLDMEMPGMDGLEALSAIRILPQGAQVPVFMITSRQQARHRAAALAAGVTRYFTKPYDGEELVRAARAVTSAAGQPSGVAVS